MKHIIKITLIFSIILYSSNIYAQSNKKGASLGIMISGDLKIVIGAWTGNITYLDYKTNKPFTMPANVIVKQGKNANTFLLYNQYPNEPKANNTDKVKITKNGTHLNKAMVTSREELANGQILVITENTAKDDNMQAVIRYTYTLGENQFIIRKDVQFEDSKDWLKRSEFNYSR